MAAQDCVLKVAVQLEQVQNSPEYVDSGFAQLYYSILVHGGLYVYHDIFLKGTDETYLDKLHTAHADSEYYKKPLKDKQEFTVLHYAGPVTYNVRKFIEKNKDVLRPDVVNLLCSSKNQVLLLLSSVCVCVHMTCLNALSSLKTLKAFCVVHLYGKFVSLSDQLVVSAGLP